MFIVEIWNEIRGQILRIRQSRRTCSPKLLEQRRLQYKVSFFGYNILLGLVVTLFWVPLLIYMAEKNIYFIIISKNTLMKIFFSFDKIFILKSLKWFITLSAARIRNESITCSAVSTSVDSLVMKSRKQSNCTYPLAFGSTIDKIRWKSISP